MKYIKEKPAWNEPRIFQVAKKMPKRLARNSRFSANSRFDEKSAGHTNDDNHSDPVQQARDSSARGALFAVDKAARQVGKNAKLINRKFQNIRQVKATAKTTNRSIQVAKQIAMETIRSTIRVAKIAVKAGVTVLKAAATAVKGLVSLVAAGGWVAVVVILVVAIIGWLLASPLSMFFAGNNGQGNTVQSIMADLSQETADKVETIREEQGKDRDVQIVYEGSEDGAMIQNGIDVLAVYSVRVYMGENYPVEINTIDDNKENIIRDTYHRMVQVSYQIRVPEDASDSDDANSSENDTETLEIIINCKSYDEMIEFFDFSNEQVQMLMQMMQPEYLEIYRTLIGITQPGGLSAAEIAQIKSCLPADLSILQQDIINSALSIVGKVNYFWGGKSIAIGWDDRWGTPIEVTAPGSPTTGTVRPFGLDCSGFVAWVYVNAGVPVAEIADVFGTHTSAQWKYSEPIAWDEAQIGDLAFFAVPGTTKYNHVGVIVSIESTGHYQVAHCASSRNNVVVGLAAESGFKYIRRPIIGG